MTIYMIEYHILRVSVHRARITAPVLGIGTSESARRRELFQRARSSVLNNLRILWDRLIGAAA